MRQAVRTPGAPAPIGPYTQAVKSGTLVFLSGQIPLDPRSGTLVEGGIEVQTRRVLENLKSVLEASGCSLADVIKTTVFLADVEHFPVVNEIYGSYFRDLYPARSTVQVAALPRGALLEIDAIALLD